jgi:hypothetical protein
LDTVGRSSTFANVNDIRITKYCTVPDSPFERYASGAGTAANQKFAGRLQAPYPCIDDVRLTDPESIHRIDAERIADWPLPDRLDLEDVLPQARTHRNFVIHRMIESLYLLFLKRPPWRRRTPPGVTANPPSGTSARQAAIAIMIAVFTS